MNNNPSLHFHRARKDARLLAAALLLFALPALGQLDISNRSFIPYAHPENIAPDSIAAGTTWVAMGHGFPTFIGSRFDPDSSLEANPIKVTGPWDGSAYIDVIIPPPDLGANIVEEFGAAIAIHGQRIAVGSPNEYYWSVFCGGACAVSWEETNGGKVRLYQFDGTDFPQERVITFGGLYDRFGVSLDLDASNLLVGSSWDPYSEYASPVQGSAHVFDPDTGTLIDSFLSPDATGSDGYGLAVALGDNLAVVGAPSADTVYVYRDDGAGNWSAAGTLTSPGTGSAFGAFVAADGSRVIVGVPGLDSAYIFEDDGDALWPVDATLVGSAGSRFGSSVSITGDTAFVGAPYLDPGGVNQAGAVERYDRQGNGTWTHTTQLTSAAPGVGQHFGALLSVSATMLSVLEPGRKGQYVYTSPANIYDPDGDGAAEIVDNCPGVANPDQTDTDGDGDGNACEDNDDNDGLSDADEALAGTDPLNPDTDGDGYWDVDDAYPLDYKDGFAEAYRFSFGYVERIALGSGVLLALHGNELRTYQETPGGWVEAAPPTISMPAGNSIDFIAMKGNRAVVYTSSANILGLHNSFHLLE